jgi:hypothetical protein
MMPEPKMSDQKPFRWVGAVVLMPADVKDLLQALPEGSDLVEGLQEASHAAKERAERLNRIERGEEAA